MAARPDDTSRPPPRFPAAARLLPAPVCLARLPVLPVPAAIRRVGPVGAAFIGTVTGAITATVATAITRPIAAAISRTISGPVTCTIAAGTILSGIENLLATLAAEIHPVIGAGADIVVAEALLHVRVVVSHALTVRRIVIPNVGGAVVDVDVAIAPVAAAAPVIAPTAERETGAERNSGRDHASANIGRITEIIGRVVRIGPGAIHRCRLVIGNIHSIRIGRLDHNRLLAVLLPDRDLLLLVAHQLVVASCLFAQALNCIHQVCLLGKHGVAKALVQSSLSLIMESTEAVLSAP